MKIHIFSTLFLLIFLLSGCTLTQNDPFLDVPEFELRTITFTEKTASPAKKKHALPFLMRWNILGPLSPVSDDIKVSSHAFTPEEEAVLCGRKDAPEGALWHVRIYRNDPVKNKLNGFCNWTDSLKKYTGKKLFYACSSFLSEKEYKNVFLTLYAAGSVCIYWNGRQVGVLQKANYPSGNAFTVKNITIRKGGNRLVLKYLDGTEKDALRGVSLQFSLDEKAPLSEKTALIR